MTKMQEEEEYPWPEKRKRGKGLYGWCYTLLLLILVRRMVGREGVARVPRRVILVVDVEEDNTQSCSMT